MGDLGELAARVEARRTAERLSHRALGTLTGVAFSTLARVAAGRGAYSRENERRLKSWLGDDVSDILSLEQRQLAAEMGRHIAHAFSAEITALVKRTLSAAPND